MTTSTPRDIINAFFRKHYPTDHKENWEMRYLGSRSSGREYRTRDGSYIFPSMICADGFTMSVQGHFGAYCYPRDDFAEEYLEVEILCPREPLFEAFQPHEVGDEVCYAYVPIKVALAAIEKHGGLIGEIATP